MPLGGGAEALRQHGIGRPSRSSSRGRATRRKSDVQASTKKLRDTLQHAEATQVADWVRIQHKAIDYDLTFTAARLEGSLPPTKKTTSSRPIPVVSGDQHEDDLATTWPLSSSSLRVDGHGLSNTLPKDAGTPVSDSFTVQEQSREDRSFSAARSGAASFARRARNAMEMHGLDANTLKEYLLPSSTDHPEDTSVQSWEVFKVLSLDVGMQLTEDDKKLIEDRFGDGGNDGRIDVNTLMVSLGLRLTESEPAQRETTYEEQARQASPSPGNVHPAPAPAPLPTRSDDKDRLKTSGFVSNNSAYRDPPRKIPTSNAFLGETPPGRGGRPGRERKVTRTDQADETADGERTLWQRPTGGEPGGIEEGYVRLDRTVKDQKDPLDPAVEDMNLPVVFAHATAETVAGVRERGGSIGEGADPSGEEPSKTILEQENARLRSELAVFDLGFFEEVEDLKYSYATLKQEATKLANKQGLDLSASLDLPEDGEEPWSRSVDMAHHSVDWRQVSKQRPRGSSSSPPRGTHAARLTRRWKAVSEGEDPEFQRARSPPPRGTEGRTTRAGLASSQDSRGRGRAEAFADSGSGVVAAHERKLAWELSSGGLTSLECLREHTRRVGRSGNVFLADEQVFMALREAGYALDADDVSTLRTGLGIDADGKVDLKEFMSMCEDIASSQEWYLPPTEMLSTETVLPTKRENETFGEAVKHNGQDPSSVFTHGGGVSSHLHRSGLFFPSSSSSEYLPHARNGGGPGESQYLGGTAYGERVFLEPLKNAEGVLAEVKDQLSLVDMDLFVANDRQGGGGGGGGGGGMATLGEAVRVKFTRRDPTLSGLLSAREVALALEDIGVVLQPDEVVTLARKFRPPPAASGPLLRREARAGNGFPFPSSSEEESRRADDDGLDGVTAEYAPLVRWIVDRIAETSGIDPTVGGRARVGGGKGKWHERMPAPASRLRAALSAGERNNWASRLRQRFQDFDMDGSGTLGRREFMRALNLALAEETGDESNTSPHQTVGGVLSREEAVELMGRLDRDRDGRVCWKDFVEYFVGADGAGSDDVPSEPWFEREGDIAHKLLEHVESQGGSAARRAWVNSLTRRFQAEDVDAVGELAKEEFSRCLRDLRVPLSMREGNRLFAALGTATEGARHGDLIDFLRSNGAKWYEMERGVADKIMQAMGPDAPSRRAWLNRMRRRFMSLDAFRAGVMGASDLLQALRDGGCYLGLDEEAKLLDALETQESARYDIDGGVSYRELLLFCARHAGRWNEAQPALAERLREALRSQAKTGADIRRLFRSLDHDRDGFIGRKDFRITLRRLGLKGDSREEEEALMDALDAEGSGRVRYGDFASFFTDTAPLSKTDSDLTERLCKSLEVEGGGGPGTVLGTLRERFVQADRGRSGYLDRAQFRRVLVSLPGTKGLTDDEISRLSGLLDEEGDGRVSYRSLLDLLVKRLGNWTKRLPEVALELSFGLKQTQYGFKACVQNLSRRIEIADHGGTGRLSPAALARCLHSVGLGLTPEQLRQMLRVMDSHGDGLIPTAPVLEFLREEAGVSARPGDVGIHKTQAGGKLEATFREAVRALAKLEQTNATDGDPPTHGRRSWEGMWGSIPLSARLRRVFDRRLDLDGDGYLTEGDLVACLPEIGVDADRKGAKMLLEAMDSRGRGLGQATFKDFTEFMGRDGASTAAGGNEETAHHPPVEKEILPALSNRRRLLQQVRLALGLSGPGHTTTTTGGAVEAIIRQDMRFALARLDPQGSGRLSLTKIKAGLQGLGLPVGKVPRESWVDLTGSLDQDANGHLFYEDLVDLLLPHAPFPPSPRNASDEKENPTWGRRRRRSLSPRPTTATTATGSTIRKRPTTTTTTTAATTTAAARRRRRREGKPAGKLGFLDDGDDDDGDDDDGDDADDDWRRTYPPPTRSRRSPPRVNPWQGGETGDAADLRPSQVSLLFERILDCVADEHGGSVGGAKALRSALRKQDLTRSGALSRGEFRMALETAGVPLTSEEVSALFHHFVRRGDDMVDYGNFVNQVLSHTRRSGLDPGREASAADGMLQDRSTIGGGGGGGVASSVQRAMSEQTPAVDSLRRQLDQRLSRRHDPLMGGLEFKRLIRSSGLELTPAQSSYLRQKCGGPSGQVNFHALLAYLGPRGIEGDTGGDEANAESDLPPNALLRGKAYQRHARQAPAGLYGAERDMHSVLATGAGEKRSRMAAALRRERAALKAALASNRKGHSGGGGGGVGHSGRFGDGGGGVGDTAGVSASRFGVGAGGVGDGVGDSGRLGGGDSGGGSRRRSIRWSGDDLDRRHTKDDALLTPYNRGTEHAVPLVRSARTSSPPPPPYRAFGSKHSNASGGRPDARSRPRSLVGGFQEDFEYC